MILTHLKQFTLLCGVIVAISASTLCGQATSDPSLSGRVDLNIDHGWKFLLQDATHAEEPNFADQAWLTLDLPHAWSVDGGTYKDYYRGPAWYRLHLDVPATLAGKDFFLRFGAASLQATVYVNGTLVGTHKGGFAAFCFEVTKTLHPGQNIIAVRVDNAIDPNVTPLSGDFTIYGGLYREVHLLALPPVSVTPLDDASSGIYLNTQTKEKTSQVQVLTKVRNSRAQAADIVMVTTIKDAERQDVQHVSTAAKIAAGETVDVHSLLTVTDPHIWNGSTAPYLYSVQIQIQEGTEVLDTMEQPLGFRTFQVDGSRGFVLNGHHYDIHGVDYHQGRISTGWASTTAMREEDYRMIAEMGATGVRMAHYQHDEDEYNWCDRLGLIVWTELALVNKVTDSPQFDENCEQQLRELIKQNYNHPSICFWSLYNELWTKPEFLPTENRLLPKLVALAHELDPQRLTTGGVAPGNEGEISWYMDVTGLNRYYGWYKGDIGDWGHELDTLAEKYPQKRLGISEYGAGASIRQHENDPKAPKPSSLWHPEEWQALVHESAWTALSKHDELWCKFVWVMFDFASNRRNEGDQPGINDKGLVTADRKTRKDAFYFYKASWSQEPFVYITDRRFSLRPAVPSILKVYSNCSSVELYIDGELLSQKTSATHIFSWPDVDLAPGEHRLKAVGSFIGKTYTDEMTFSAVAPPPHTIP